MNNFRSKRTILTQIYTFSNQNDRQDDLLMLWRQYFGWKGVCAFCWKRKGPRKETSLLIDNSIKMNNSHSNLHILKSKWPISNHFCFLFDDVALNTISLRWVWVVGHSALHFPTQYPRWAVRHSLPTISPVWVYAGLLKEEKREAIQSLWERTGGLVLTTTTTTFTKKIQIHLLVSFSPIGYYHIPITIPQIPRERVNSLFVN